MLAYRGTFAGAVATKRNCGSQPTGVQYVRRVALRHVPLVIAILALAAFVLLPQLDRYAGPETGKLALPSYLVRLAHWVNA